MDMNATSEQLHGPHNPEVRHERSDVSARGVVGFGAGLLVAAVIIYLIIWGLFAYFASRTAQGNRPLSAAALRGPGELKPPEPHLQVSPREDLQALRVEEDAILNHYGWADRQANTVHIPVERAMHLLTQRGLPVQQDGTGASDPRGIGGEQ